MRIMYRDTASKLSCVEEIVSAHGVYSRYKDKQTRGVAMLAYSGCAYFVEANDPAEIDAICESLVEKDFADLRGHNIFLVDEPSSDEGFEAEIGGTGDDAYDFYGDISDAGTDCIDIHDFLNP